MYLRLVLLGSGTDDDPYHVALPSYTIIAIDYGNMWAVVSISTRNGPNPLPAKGSPLYPLEGDTYVLIGVEQATLGAWWQRLANSYPDADPPYRPDFP